jgi:hypothetical protein
MASPLFFFRFGASLSALSEHPPPMTSNSKKKKKRKREKRKKESMSTPVRKGVQIGALVSAYCAQ